MFLDVLRSYPLVAVFVIFLPILTGLATAYLGYDGLATRLTSDRQMQRIESGVESLQVPAETLRRYENSLQSFGQQSDLLRRILHQYDQLKGGIGTFEQISGRPQSAERLAAAQRTLQDLSAVLGSAYTQPIGPANGALILKTAPNTFRVTFSVPMRITPTLEFYGLPTGVIVHVLEQSPLGFTVVFTPIGVDVDHFDFTASAEL